MLILIVEDDDSIAESLSELCLHWNVTCKVVGTLEEGMESLKKDKPDIIILDLILRGKMGIPIMVEARKQINPPCLILCTAWNGADKIAEEYKPDYFIKKPFNIETIEEIINKKCV